MDAFKCGSDSKNKIETYLQISIGKILNLTNIKNVYMDVINERVVLMILFLQLITKVSTSTQIDTIST